MLAEHAMVDHVPSPDSKDRRQSQLSSAEYFMIHERARTRGDVLELLGLVGIDGHSVKWLVTPEGWRRLDLNYCWP